MPGRYWALFVVLLVVGAGIAIYGATLPGPPPHMPTIWSAGPQSCNPCAVASDAQNLYELEEVNVSYNATFNYTLNAYNWSTGQEAWPSVSVEIGDGFASFQMGQQLTTADIFADAGTVALVTAGTWELESGPSSEFSYSPGGCAVWVLEWNASTGIPIQTLHSTNLGGCFFPAVYATVNAGWATVATFDASFGAVPENLTATTFPLGTPSSQYGQWSTNFSILPSHPPLILFAALSMGGGLVSFSTMGPDPVTVVLDGQSGSQIWEGAIPDLYTVPETADMSPIPQVFGPSTYVVQRGESFYYIGNETGEIFLGSFDYSTNTTVDLANLTGRVDPLNCQLTLTSQGVLVVTEAAKEHYWAYSTAGSPLWNLSLALSQTSSTGDTNVGGIDISPVQAGGGYLFLGSIWSWSSASWSDNNYPTATWAVPLAIVNGTTGQPLWQMSYSVTQTMGPNASYPETYLPLLAEGPFLAFIHYPGSGLGWALSVAQFAGIPYSST